MKKKQYTKTIPQKSFLSLPAKDSMLKLSLYTINITFLISARVIFISKAAKNGLTLTRIFRAQTAMHFFVSKEHYLENCNTQHSFQKIVTVLL